MSPRARERLVVAMVLGFCIGAIFAAFTGNPLSITAGVAVLVAMEVGHLAWQARIRRKSRVEKPLVILRDEAAA